ncbi:cytochrome b-c1 complex subunit 2, mitochondrial isoform X1 [Galleria mellonella]|uniref:Cytochrome b-c1 complex subunit 2, mitochondrial isoform X1 n=1 Tax=Galleria mellonella TaxID=7137 RepID=A0A6J1X757_GALME|nr:cytochrome b-c1 complex subunit 2, mitochondrial isoform X1 [Galleria mellonella]
MASKALASPLIRHVAKRGYAQAAPAVRKDSRIQATVLPNKTFVAALDNGSPVTRVTVVFRAGSRYEPQTELGITHVLRTAAGLTTKNASVFMIARKLAQIGATVSASGDREFVYYTLEATQDNLPEALEYLNNIVSNQEFRPWELSDITPRQRYEIAALPPQVRAIDLLHKAAYRRGLGNSLFISPKRIGKVSSESLQHYASTTLTPGRCAVAVIGDSQDKATLVAQKLQLPTSGDAQGEASTYYGGELRKEIGGDLAHLAIAVQGAPAGSPQSLALAVAAKALGNGPVTKWGADNSPLAKAVGNIGPFAAAGFNVSYSDTGLFGVVLSVPKDEANVATKAVVKLIKSPTLSAEAIQAGKNQLKLQILSEAETGTSLAESIAAQGLYTGNVKSPADLAKDVDNISNSDVSQVLANAAKSKISIGAAGNLAFVPYVDEL